MIVRILLQGSEMLYAKENELFLLVKGGDKPAMEISTRYQSDKPDIKKERIFVSEHGGIRRG